MDTSSTPTSTVARTASKLVRDHLERHPQDQGYVQLLLENREFSPTDKKYLAWLKYNLTGIDSGHRLVGRIEAVTGPLGAVRVLDIGAGGGGNSIALAERGCPVTALEIDELRLTWLRRRVADHGLPVTICSELLETLPAHQRFDVVICNAVLEHVDDWQALLAELLRRCPSGAIFVTWPNRYSLLEIWSDQHYGLLGGVFLTGRLRHLQQPYIRLRGITRDAWVVDVPSFRSVSHYLRACGPHSAVHDLPPEGFDKVRHPETINHAGARRVVTLLRKLGITENHLARLVNSQKHTREILIVTGQANQAA